MNRMADALLYIAAAVLIIDGYITGREQLHMAQLEGYKANQYWWWIKNNFKYLFLNEGILFLLTFAVYLSNKFLMLYVTEAPYILLGLWLLAGSCLIYFRLRVKKQAKKPLVYTHRATRLLGFYFLLLIIWIFLSFIYIKNTSLYIISMAIARFFMPFYMLLSIYLMFPVEMAFQYRYFHSAQIKLMGMKNLKVIGITGSYGKTSTKYFVKTILAEKYNTLMTPESYNTPMGITRVIREQLNENHEVFVCEMGARKQGDIKTLCKLVNPSIGILTSIGLQHMETFKTLENVSRTMYELIEALPYYGTAIFNGDNRYCLEIARKTGIDTLTYSSQKKGEDIYLAAGNIVSSREGLRFTVYMEEGVEFECQTSLLGKHNVSNMLAAICAAVRLGMTIEEIQRGIAKIKPVPHRLQILSTENGVTVIDDTFNSNPQGAREAIETIGGFTGGNRIVVTPGMVELGSIEYKENRKLGRIIADCCDYAILVGVKRSKPIIEGLREKKFPADRIITVSTLKEAYKKLDKIVKAGDVVLYENDLPDNYN